MQLSKLEDLAYQILKKNNLSIFKSKDIKLLLNIDKIKAYNLVKALKKKGVIKKTGKRFLALSETNDFLMMETNVHKTNGHDVLIALPGEQRFLLITKTPCSTEKTDDTTWRKNNIDNKLAILTQKTSLLFTPQMIELEKLGGVSFEKGCYVGQEIVARTQHLGQLKRHLHRITLTEHHEPGDKITYDGKSGVVVDSVKIGKNEYVALAVMCD